MSADDDFKNKMGEIVAHGVINVGVALGTRLGLFERLAKIAQSKEGAVTTQQLADSMQYKERYVREWINGMACSDIVDHVEVSGEDRYWLEPYRLPALLGDKMGCVAQRSELGLAIAASSKLTEPCFPLDGPKGSKVDEHPEMHEFLRRRHSVWARAENADAFCDKDLKGRLEQGIDVLEMGCGAATPINLLALGYPKGRYVASDLSETNLAIAKENCKGLDNVSYAVLDACSIPEEMTGKFDFVMLFDLYHDVPYPEKLLHGALRLLRPGGRFLMNEINVHEKVSDNKANKGITAGAFYGSSTVYCVPTSYIHPGGEGLGACAGMELYDRTLKKEFKEVKKVAKDFGLYFLCTK